MEDFMSKAKILSVGTAVPDTSYTQADLLKMLDLSDPRIARLFLTTHIKKRHLFLPNVDTKLNEPQGVLLKKHLEGGLIIGTAAITKALERANIQLDDVGFFAVVTSTGFLLPGLSARLIKHLNIHDDVHRLDIVGMGCNAGLNGLAAANNWALANPNRYALLLCVEICSGLYVNDGTLRSSVVNSLFGDGAAAAVIKASPRSDKEMYPEIHGFTSHIVTDAIEAMHYDWNESENKFSFYLHHTNPYLVGDAISKPVDKLLKKFNLSKDEIAHWIVHTGGKNVISAVKYSLDISSHALRHTSSILKDYGNVSSGSFLFSYERLLKENSDKDNTIITKGDYGVCITIGPGAQFETALLKW